MSGHHWTMFDGPESTFYCNVCKTAVLKHGSECDFCTIKVDDRCIKRADATIKCKPLSCAGSVQHHWVSSLKADICLFYDTIGIF